MSKAAVAFVEFDGDFTKIGKQATAQSKGLQSLFAGSFKKIAEFGTAALVGAVAGAADIGTKFEGSFNTIARGTGATGKALDNLEQSFKTVLASGSGSFDQVSQAITLVFQRTGLMGKALDDFASKQVTLARITKTDVGENLQTTTALFNLYGIAVGKQSSELDVLFKASQLAGVTITQLASDMQAAAPTAKILGLTFDQTATLTANLEKAGLPASRVMLGLASSFVKAAKAGKNPLSVIADLVAEVKKAPSATAAATIAVSKFGISARAAAVLVSGIRSGAIDLTKSLDASGPGINATAAATTTLSGSLAHLKNVALVGLAPIAEKVLGVVTSAIKAMTGPLAELLPKLQALGGLAQFAFQIGFGGKNIDGIHGWLRVFADLGAALHKFVDFAKSTLIPIAIAVGRAIATAFEWLVDHKDVLKAVLAGIAVGFTVWAGAAALAAIATLAASLPLVLLVVGLAAVAAAVVFAYEHFKTFHDVVDEFATMVRTDFKKADDVLSNIDWGDVFQRVAGDIRSAIDAVRDAIGGVVDFVKSHAKDFDAIGHQFAQVWQQLVPTLQATFGAIEAVFKVVFGVIAGITVAVVAVLTDLWDRFGHQLLDHIRVAFDGIAQTVRGALQVIEGVMEVVTGIFTGKWSKVWDGIKDIVGGVWGVIVGQAKFGLTVLSALIGGTVAAISAAWDGLWSGFTDVAAGIWGGIERAVASGINGIIDLINGLIKAYNALPFLGNIKPLGHVHFAVTQTGTVKTPLIGKFAHGGVVTSPMLGLVGENSRTTPEIISPVKLMADTFRAVLLSIPAQTVVLAGKNLSADATGALRSVKDYLTALARVPATVLTKVTADTQPASKSYTDLVGAITISMAPTERATAQFQDLGAQVALDAVRFKASSGSVRDSVNIVGKTLQRFPTAITPPTANAAPVTVLPAARPSAVAVPKLSTQRLLDGLADDFIKFQQQQTKAAPTPSIVGVENQVIHLENKDPIEELAVLNSKLGMRVALAGRR